MKSYTITCLLAVGCLQTLHTQAQTADDILKKYIAARGGEQLLKGVKSLYIEGECKVKGIKGSIRSWAVDDAGRRIEMSILTTRFTTAVTKNNGWTQIGEKGTAKVMTDKELNNNNKGLDLSDLAGYKEKGKVATLKGKETVNGKPVYKILVTGGNEPAREMFIDAVSYLPVRIQTNKMVDGKETYETMEYGEYKKTPGGYVYAGKSYAKEAGLSITVTRVDVNLPVNNDLFKAPR
ncbi:hypothetical protein KTO58_21445 [Chitinophaga pendula]|uniref:hypothetical protein n=1 Tax=Chitinophaga TaxID=79328 RepID=UPI000BAFD058|nr:MULTISPECIES: hypothetical protein [Chitinophaga]ASZ10806.1 hypothetical protein CK934_07355 [Chitinophaga sp. MD30]UCJ06215.1 hypothetical protein KTO58_21445 [Chitinophaga pendula]